MKNSDKIFLRPISVSDTPNILKWRNSEMVKSNFIYQKEITEEEHLNWLNTKVKNKEVIQFIIVEKSMDRAIGSVYLRDIDMNHKKAEYGIFIGEADALGKGYGTIAAKLMLDYTFCELGLHKVYLRVLASNLQAIASYEKAGFRKVALLKDEVRISNKYRDLVWMEIINPEDY